MYNFSLFLLLVGLILGTFQPIAAKEQDQERLIKMVVLSRHGLRSPIVPNSELDEWTQKEWPYWPVNNGYLTSRGSILISNLWEALREDPWLNELLPQDICPNPELIYVRANTAERTQATAVAILNGLAPGCGLKYFVFDSKNKDPLFNSTETGDYPVDMSKVFQEFYQQYKEVQEIQKELEKPLGLIVDILGPCPKETCKKYGLPEGCTILDIPSSVFFNKKKKKLKFIGGLHFASVATECFLFMQGEWPRGNQTNLNISYEQLEQLYPIYNTLSNIVNRLPEMATSRGSLLLNAIADALTSSDVDSNINKAKLVIFSGHEGNIQSIAGLLNLQWKIHGYPPNGTPPGGMLMFTLWETPNGNIVKIHYVCQELEAIVSPVGYPQKFFKQQLKVIPYTSSSYTNTEQLECSEKQFRDWIDNVVDKNLLPKQKVLLKSKRVL